MIKKTILGSRPTHCEVIWYDTWPVCKLGEAGAEPTHFAERDFFEMFFFFRKFCPTLKTFFGQVNSLLAWGASVGRCKKFKTPQNVIFTIFKKFKFEKKFFWARKKFGQIFFWTFTFFEKIGLKACQICLSPWKNEKNLKKIFQWNFFDEISKMLNFKGSEPFLATYKLPQIRKSQKLSFSIFSDHIWPFKIENKKIFDKSLLFAHCVTARCA